MPNAVLFLSVSWYLFLSYFPFPCPDSLSPFPSLSHFFFFFSYRVAKNPPLGWQMTVGSFSDLRLCLITIIIGYFFYLSRLSFSRLLFLSLFYPFYYHFEAIFLIIDWHILIGFVVGGAPLFFVPIVRKSLTILGQLVKRSKVYSFFLLFPSSFPEPPSFPPLRIGRKHQRMSFL